MVVDLVDTWSASSDRNPGVADVFEAIYQFIVGYRPPGKEASYFSRGVVVDYDEQKAEQELIP